LITSTEIEKYCIDHSSNEDSIFSELALKTTEYAPQVSHMQVGSLEGGLLRMFVRMMNAKRVLEFGTFTGCSSLHFLLAMPKGGAITTLDRDARAVAIAQEFWKKAQVIDRVESFVQDAKKSAAQLVDEVNQGARQLYDLAFIDADKGSYESYFESSLKLVRPGGWILVDNLLWGGAVLDPREKSDQIIHSFNEARKRDSRIESLLLPIRDGIAVYQIKGQ
jgi:caffeoyl-CoA O-methyltransferase